MSKKILIVEDNELNMKLFRDLLEVHGYTTIETRDGREALELAREHRPDLILMDIHMPEMDGIAATQRIRQLEGDGHRVPIIAVTANTDVEDRESYIDAGMDDCLAKPIDTARLLDKLQGWLEVEEVLAAGARHAAVPAAAQVAAQETPQAAPISNREVERALRPIMRRLDDLEARLMKEAS